jgi:hypothetical protein
MNFKETRRNLMVLANTVDTLEKSRELSLVKTALQTAMMWSGTYLKFTNTGDNPYAKSDGNRTSVEDIEPMFDATAGTLDKEILNQGTIYVVDQMREHLSKLLGSLTTFISSGEKIQEREDSLEENMALFNIINNTTEARMWLGMELRRLKR